MADPREPRTTGIRADLLDLIAYRDKQHPYRRQPVSGYLAALLSRAAADGTLARLKRLSRAELNTLCGKEPNPTGPLPTRLSLPADVWADIEAVGAHQHPRRAASMGLNRILVALVEADRLTLTKLEIDTYAPEKKATKRKAYSRRSGPPKPAGRVRTFWVSDEHYALLAARGNGNASVALRAILDALPADVTPAWLALPPA